MTSTRHFPHGSEPIVDDRPSTLALSSTTDRLAVGLRAVWAFYALLALTAGLAAGTTSHSPATLLTFFVITAWPLLMEFAYRRTGGISPKIGLVDALSGIFLLVLGPELIPTGLVGDGSSWVVMGGALSALIATWCLKPQAALVFCVLIAGAYLVGIVLHQGDATGNQWVTLAYHAAVVGVVAILTRRVRHATAFLDECIAELALARQAYLAEQIRLEFLRNRERKLHDYVLTALGLVSNNSLAVQPGALREQCQQALEEFKEVANRVESSKVPITVNDFDDVLSELRGLGLGLSVEIDAVARKQLNLMEKERTSVLCSALRQTLINVLRHAEASNTEVTISVMDETITVTVTDDGIGFTDDSINPASRGLQSSIRAALQDIGGSSEVISAVGIGTSVRLSLPLGGTKSGTPGGRKDSNAPSSDLVSKTLELSAAGTVASMGLAWHLLSLGFLLRGWNGYKSPTVAFSVWLGMLILQLLVISRRETIHRASAWSTAFLLTIGAVSVALLCQPPGLMGYENWGLGGLGFLLAYQVVVRAPFAFIIGVLAMDLVTIALVTVTVVPGLDANATTAVLMKLSGVILGTVALQIGLIAYYLRLVGVGQSIQATLAKSDATRAEIEALRLVNLDRNNYFSSVDRSAEALLAGLADGSMDPGSAAVREDCRRVERDLRKSYSPAFEHIMARELLAFAVAAGTCGLSVDVRCTDSSPSLTADECHWLGDQMTSILPYCAKGDATVTVIGGIDLASSDGLANQGRASVKQDTVTVTLLVPIRPKEQGKIEKILSSAKPRGSVRLAWGFDDSGGDRGHTSAGGSQLWLAASGKVRSE